MKIKQFDIAGFRSLKNVSWQPGDLNVVIGQNGTGKSNLLRMLELIAVSAKGNLSKYVQKSGGMGAITWDGIAETISFFLTIREDSPTKAIGNYYDNRYELILSRLGQSASYQIQREAWIKSEVLAAEASRQEIASTEQKIIERTGALQFYEKTRVQAESPEESLLSMQSLLLPPWLQELIGNHPTEPKKSFREELASIAVYHDLNVSQKSEVRQAAIARFERRVEQDGQNLVPVLHTLYTGDREFKRSIDSAMRAAFSGDYEELVFTPDAGDQRIQMKVRWRSLQRAQSAADLSDGTLRFLFLLTVLIAPDSPMLIAIDEPETGLHPSMLPIIAEFAVEASSRTQIIFTTHSPQFLDAFTDTKPTTTVTKWENGETSLHVLNEEELAYWLREYSLGELFRAGDLEAIA